MRERPLSITLFSLLMVGVFLSIPIQAVYLQNLDSLFRSLTTLNVIMAALCLASAVTAYHVHRSFYYLLPVTIMTVLYNNWWVGSVGFNFSFTQTSVASAGFIILCTALLEKKALKVLLNPKLKWWDVALRQKVEIPVSLIKIRGQSLTKTAFDISESGLFLQGLEKQELERYRIGEYLDVCLHFSEIIRIRCQAKIVRKADSNGMYPAGLGLQFIDSQGTARAKIQRLIQPEENTSTALAS